MKPKKHHMLSLTVFLLISIVLSSFYAMGERQKLLQSRERHHYIAANQSNIIRDRIDMVLARVYVLSALIFDNDGDISFFDSEAPRIFREAVAITGVNLKNIAVAPEGIVAKVYPLFGNEALVGFDFMDGSKAGNEDAIQAYRKGALILTNPFSLVQGTTGMAGRLPIFLGAEDEQDFWGFVTVTMDFEELIESLNMKALSDSGVNYRLWYESSEGKPVILSESTEMVSHPVCYEFTLQNLTWYIDVSPVEGWIDYTSILLSILAITGISLLITLLFQEKARIKTANHELQQIANLDCLTSCYSRHYVNTALIDQRNGGWNDSTAKYSLAVIDIDNFKSINDTYGHETGDRALIALTQILMANSREEWGDRVVRHGGDEFVILYNNITKDQFIRKMDAILRDTREIRFPDYKNIRFTISIGGVHYSDTESDKYFDMLQEADKKLYVSKSRGRNQFTL